MIPILYRADETLFTSNGVGRLPDCVSCVVTEERNGIYECEFQYPVTGRLYNLIKPGMIIAVTHDNNHDVQPFDIYAYTAPIDGVVTFYARHISYRLSNIILQPFSANSCAEALQRMKTRVYNNNPFNFWTDKAVDGVWTNPVPASIKARLVGESGSILDVYGKGEYEFDKWAVKLHVNRGRDTGIDIRYGVNLSDFEQEINNGESYTAVAPFWRSADGAEVITLPEGYVTADEIPVELMPWTTNTGEYVRDNNGEIIYFNVPNIKPVSLDLSAEFQEKPTIAQLRSLAKSRLNSSSAWLPDENITIDFVDQAGTYDGIDIAALRPVTLCDRVNVYCGPLNVAATQIQCVRLVYDVLNERNAELELGTVRPTYSQTLKQSLSGNMVSKAQADALITTALDSATQQITGATDSHVKFVYDSNGGLQEILIMDTEDIETAQRIWRWNSGGLGYSSTGYAGPYGLAMTQDGTIVADFIKAGVISDLGGNNYWNLITGVLNTQVGQIGAFTLNGGAFEYSNGNKTALIDSDGVTFQNMYTNTLFKTNVYGQGIQIFNPSKGNSWGMFSTDLYSGQAAKNYTWAILGYKSGNNFTSYINFFPASSDETLSDEHIQLRRRTLTNYNAYIAGASLYFGASLSGILTDYGRIYLSGSSTLYFMRNAQTHMYFEAYNGGSRTVFTPNVYCINGLTVSGTKSRVVETSDYGNRLLYCYETPTPMFGDIGEGVISDSGDCYVWLDPVFAETVEGYGYQVFLQPYGRGECYVSERKSAYFVVSGDSGLAFGWEIKAKQSGYDQLRIEREDLRTSGTDGPDFGASAIEHITTIQKGRILNNE